MSVVSLLLGQAQRGTRITRDLTETGVMAAIILDATLSEDFSAPSELTQHPVQSGADIGDHIILKPQSVTIKGKISETPFNIAGQLAGVAVAQASRVGQKLGGALGAVAATAVAAKTMAGLITPSSVTGQKVFDSEGGRSALGLPNDNVRLRDAIEEFMNIRKAKAPVSIVTGLRLYKDFVLTEFSVTKDSAMGKALMVSLKFNELQLATVEEVAVSIPGEKQGLGSADLGSKAAEPAASDSSIAFDLIFGG